MNAVAVIMHAMNLIRVNPDLRNGQAIYTSAVELYGVHDVPEDKDPFYFDRNIRAFFFWLEAQDV